MRTVYIILGILLLLFIGFQIYVINSRSEIEKYSYHVSKKYEGFEIRNYNATLFTAVKLTTNDYKKASGKGFSVLAGNFLVETKRMIK